MADLDNPLEEPRPPRYSILLRIVLFLLLILTVGFALVAALTGQNPLVLLQQKGMTGLVERTSSDLNKTPEIVKEMGTVEPGVDVAMTSVGGNLVYCAGNDLRAVDDTGEELWYLAVKLNHPVLVAEGKDVLVADLSGRYLALVRDGHNLWEKTLEEDIVNVRLVRDWVFVITRSSNTGYHMTVRSYTRDGTAVAYRPIADYLPFAVWQDANFDASTLVVAGVASGDLKTQSVVEFWTTAMKPKGSRKSETGIYSAAQETGGRMAVISETGVFAVDKGAKTQWEYQPDDAEIASSTANGSGQLVLACFLRSQYERDRTERTEIRTLDGGSGKVRSGFTVDGRVHRILPAGDNLVLLWDNQVQVVDGHGNVLRSHLARNGISAAAVGQGKALYLAADGKLISIQLPARAKFLGIF